MKALWELFFTFFKLGLFTFGGGYAMIPPLKETVINKKKWLKEDEVLDMIAIAESTPGPIAINMATFVGHKQKGFWGSFWATIGVVLPSLIIIFCISLFFEAFSQNVYVKYAFVGIKCAVAILILTTGIEMIVKLKKKALNIVLLIISLLLMIVIELFALNITSILLILFGGIVSIIVGVIQYGKQKSKLQEKLIKEENNAQKENQQKSKKTSKTKVDRGVTK